MKLKDILLKAGSTALGIAFPQAAPIISAINLLLPSDKKLLETASGSDIDQALMSMPEDQRAVILDKEFDLKKTKVIEANASIRAMLHADKNSQQSTRPKIAYQSFQVYAASTTLLVGMIAYSVVNTKDPLDSLNDAWPLILALLAPLATLLHAYFGMIKEEHKNRLNAANGIEAVGGIVGLLSKRK